MEGPQGQIPGAGHGPAGGGVAPGPSPVPHIAGHDRGGQITGSISVGPPPNRECSTLCAGWWE